jgi:four helix bundle protein
MTGLLDDQKVKENAIGNGRSSLVREAWDMEVYKLAYSISLDVHKRTLAFPAIERFELASQMRRCSKGICANLVEGFAKQPFSTAEFKRFISMAIGSAAEMQVWTNYSLDLGYIENFVASIWRAEYRSISRMLMKLSKNT